MAVGILAYGYALVDPALNLDEQIAPAFGTLGRANAWNLGIFRWGTVIFNYAVLGPANLHVLRPILALGVLSIAATVYARLLPTSCVARAFFCVTFVTLPTFAHAMAFSFQSVEFALAILLFVLGLKSFVAATSGPLVDGAGLVKTLVLWVLASSFYQDYGVILAASLCWAFFAVAAGKRTMLPRRAMAFVAVLAVSVMLNVIIAWTLVWLAGVSRPTYLTGRFGAATLGARISALLRGAASLYFSGDAPGRLSLGVTAVSLPLLGLFVRGSVVRRVGLALLGAAVCLAPIAYGLGSIPPLRATSGLLFVVAGTAAFAVERSPQPISFFVKCAVLYLLLQNAAAVNDVFRYESLAWEADKMLAIELAARIHEVAPDAHDGSAVRVLFAGSYRRQLASELPGQDSWVGAFDTWGENKTERRRRALNAAGFPAFQLATEKDYRTALPILERIPAWPDPRSVLRDGDVVIVKLGPLNGFGRL